MNYLSVCSGIEAASVAWHSLGWHPVAFSEIESFPCAVLAHRFPDVPNLGDMTKFKEWKIADRIDLLVGGTPCQSFSVAGLRKGLDDPRGNLILTFGAIAAHFQPRWLLWENVPGVLSSNGGRDFGTFLGMLAELGYGFAYRVLDAQYFGVPQRRRRVFVVGYLGDWRRAAAVLFEHESLRGDTAPRKKAGQEVAGTLGRSVGKSTELDGHGAYVTCDVCGTICADSHPGSYSGQDAYTGRLVAHTLRAEHDASEDGTGRVVAMVFDPQSGGDCRGLDLRDTAQLQRCQISAVCYSPQNDVPFDRDKPYLKCSVCGVRHYGPGDKCEAHTLEGCGGGNNKQAVCFEPGSVARNAGSSGEQSTAPTLRKDAGDNQPAVRIGSTVRRLTTREYERLQGFPDDWTAIPYRGKPAADGPRYKAIGNSMAVPVMRWIGERIQMVDELITTTDGPVE